MHKLERYNHIDFTPPQGVIDEAARGLAWRRKYGRGGTAVGVARARDLSNGARVSPDTIRRMTSYFARHAIDSDAAGWRPGEDGYPSAGRIAWALWGGDAGAAWSGKIARQMDAADEGAKAIAELHVRAQRLMARYKTFTPRMMGMITSNAYQDRDGEYITTAALEDWVQRARAEGRFENHAIPLLWAHNHPDLTGLDSPPPVIGWVIHAETDGAWLIEIAIERDHPLARVIWDAMQYKPAAWGVSHGFHHTEGSPRGEGRIYRYIDKFETSVLLADAASNPYTEVLFLSNHDKEQEHGSQENSTQE